MARRQTAKAAWSHDFQSWVITDEARSNLCVVDTNKSRGMAEMRSKQREYDLQVAKYHGDVDGDCALA